MFTIILKIFVKIHCQYKQKTYIRITNKLKLKEMKTFNSDWQVKTMIEDSLKWDYNSDFSVSCVNNGVEITILNTSAQRDELNELLSRFTEVKISGRKRIVYNIVRQSVKKLEFKILSVEY